MKHHLEDIKMKLHNIYSESIANLPKHISEEIIKEAPHTQIIGELPPELEMLNGAFIDLGFENLAIPAEEKRKLYKAFIGHGVAIPNTNYKLRYTRTGVTVLEPNDEAPPLPENWLEAVLVLHGDKILYAGKLVRKDQLGQ